MMLKNWKSQAVATVLALAVLVPTAAFAGDALKGSGEVPGKGFGHHQPFNAEQQQERQDQMLEIVSKYTPGDLTQWQSVLVEQKQLREKLQAQRPTGPQLSEETREKVQAIRENVKSGKLTREQADAQLKELGIEKPQNRPEMKKDRPELSAEIKEKLAALHKDLKAGTITEAQFKAEMDKLGLKASGIEKPQNRPEMKKDRPELSAEVQEKLAALHKDLKAGTITEAQFKAEMDKLGLKPREGRDQDDLRVQFKAAVEKEDATKLKELLPQMLKEMQERNQKLSNKLEAAE